MAPTNSYEDAQRAEAYARLEFAGTYYLAFRDLPGILDAHVRGRRALDFGCGAGRSTRFLRRLGFETIGVDISDDMLAQAHALDPGGDYRRIGDGDFATLDPGGFDLVLCAFPFDNVPTLERKVRLLRGLGGLLAAGGRIVNIVSSPEIYRHEWASFSTRDYPENARARSGDKVRIVITDIADPRPVEDILWTDEDYGQTYARAGLDTLATYRPLGRDGEPARWVNETRIAPWTIHVLGRGATPEAAAPPPHLP